MFIAYELKKTIVKKFVYLLNVLVKSTTVITIVNNIMGV